MTKYPKQETRQNISFDIFCNYIMLFRQSLPLVDQKICVGVSRLTLDGICNINESVLEMLVLEAVDVPPTSSPPSSRTDLS